MMREAPSCPLSCPRPISANAMAVAVDGISFQVGRREIVGLLGPNGAGKTTAINMLLGGARTLEPGSGTIHVEGMLQAAHRLTA